MSLRGELIQRGRPQLMAAAKREVLRREDAKGCEPALLDRPVALEPPFHPLWEGAPPPRAAGVVVARIEDPPGPAELIRFQVRVSPAREAKWADCELFLKQLRHVTHRIGFEIAGNSESVDLRILCFQEDAALLDTAFKGAFEEARLLPMATDPLFDLPEGAWTGAAFNDYLPHPPYYHLLTRLSEIRRSPFESLMPALAALPESALGVYQILFQPVSADHDWFRNVQMLWDMEFGQKLWTNLPLPTRHIQQTPSGDLHQMTEEAVTKAHNDKAFFSMAFRLGIFGLEGAARPALHALSAFAALFQHGGRPLQWVTEDAYTAMLRPEGIREMFLLGLTYRPGFLVNSWELTGPVHLPPADLFDRRRLPVAVLNPFPVRNGDFNAGTPIGIGERDGREVTVCVPLRVRGRHTHSIGRSHVGKTTLMAAMSLHDICRGEGIAVLDPHGDLIDRLLDRIPPEHHHRVIYLDFGDPDWVPLWNLLHTLGGHDPGRTADEIVTAYKGIMTGWGDRLEHLLRHAVYGIIHLPDSCLLDVAVLLAKDGPDSETLRKAILKAVPPGSRVHRFWRQDYKGYRGEALTPAQHKLSKILLGGTLELMLSQPESRINLRDIMDQGNILLVDLSTVGPDQRRVLGRLILSLLHLAAVARSGVPRSQWKPFHVYCDESHQFVGEEIESLIAETRKFHVDLMLAHQYLAQFGPKRADALANTGATIIHNVDAQDAQRLCKDLQGKVTVKDLTGLGQYEAIARIDKDVVRIRTPEYEPPEPSDFRERIIAESRRRYCRRADEVYRAIHRRGDTGRYVLSLAPPSEVKELEYDEFGK